MDPDLEYVKLLVEATLTCMGEAAPDWEVDGLSYYDLDARDQTDKWSEAVYVSLRSPSGKYEEVWVYFTRSHLSLAWSTVNSAGAIQDHAVEVTDGEPLPPCPGHAHPLTPTVVDGVPMWVCMQQGAAYYAHDILPGFDPSFETPEEYLLLNGSAR
jgi:hypothetical protein